MSLLPKGHIKIKIGNKIVREIDNTIMKSGKDFILDIIFGDNADYGSAAIAYMMIGSSNSTNAGVSGPETGNLSIDGAWQGVSLTDYRPNGFISASEISFIRTNEEVEARATFQAADFGSATLNIREICLSLTDTVPSAAPWDDTNEKINTVVTRGVLFQNSGNEPTEYYIDSPIVWDTSTGEDIELLYEVSL